MVTRTTTYDYEVSSESGRERHVRIPYANLEDATPTLHDPAQVDGIAGLELNGTIIMLDAVDSVVIMNVAEGATYWHNVRNVLTYSQGAEATFGALAIGSRVYYDVSATMPAGCYLSTSPLDNQGNANSPFGWIVLDQDETASDYTKGTALAGSTHVCAVLQGH